MKKTITLAALAVALLLPLHSNAQISINAGYISQQHNLNFSSLTQEFKQKEERMNGFFLGATLNIPLIGRLSIAPGAYLSYAHMRQVLERGFNPSTTSAAIKVPMFACFNFPLGGGTKIFIFAGPTFNIGFSSISNMTQSGNTRDLYFDLGGAIGAGAQFGRIRAFLGYNANYIDRDNFNYKSRESYIEAWQGSTLFIGLGLSLGKNN